jgi:hypothetical protein
VRSSDHLKAKFNEYCDEFLELESVSDYKSFNGTLAYGYFLKVYKAAFFWKKITFEQKRQTFLSKRRGYLIDKEFALYKATVDKQEKADEECLQSILNALYDKIDVTEEQFQ